MNNCFQKCFLGWPWPASRIQLCRRMKSNRNWGYCPCRASASTPDTHKNTHLCELCLFFSAIISLRSCISGDVSGQRAGSGLLLFPRSTHPPARRVPCVCRSGLNSCTPARFPPSSGCRRPRSRRRSPRPPGRRTARWCPGTARQRRCGRCTPGMRGSSASKRPACLGPVC